jgi:hypothetical protein
MDAESRGKLGICWTLHGMTRMARDENRVLSRADIDRVRTKSWQARGLITVAASVGEGWVRGGG